MSQTYVVTVSRIVERIKEIIKREVKMDSVWVQGEISNLTKHRSGHYYFSLKDEKTSMSCVMFSSYVKLLQFDLQEGMKVRVQPDVDIFVQRGSLQLYVKKIQPEGIGDLHLQLKEREKRLRDAGYFDPTHKKEKPAIIENIGIITAKEGAALQDVLKTLHHRWPMMNTTLYPALVQGNNAPKTIVEQLKIADLNHHDAILLVRGGGSFEDLFCFNDEEIVKTIYAMNTYVVTGVGHEVDTTLVDLVSDHRAVTPTAAAQWVSLDQYEVKEHIQRAHQQMRLLLEKRIQQQRSQLHAYQSHPYLQEPKSWLLDKRLRLDHLETQMDHMKESILSQSSDIEYKKEKMVQLLKQRIEGVRYLISNKENEVSSTIDTFRNTTRQHLLKNIQLLDAYSPLQTLIRGYSISTSDDKVIKTINQVELDQVLETTVHDGVITSKVIKKEKH